MHVHTQTHTHMHMHTHTHTHNMFLAALEATVGSGVISRHKPSLEALAGLIYLSLTTLSGSPTLGEVYTHMHAHTKIDTHTHTHTHTHTRTHTHTQTSTHAHTHLLIQRLL